MLRVCGVTFDRTTNYGSCFQAFALQSAVEKIVIGEEHCHYDLVPLGKFPNKTKTATKDKMIKRIKRYIVSCLNKRREEQFNGFYDQTMHYADCKSDLELPALNEQYDAFVCGSDVIWNFTYTKANPVYFLNFAEKYKFSYAASFGKADIFTDTDLEGIDEASETVYRRGISRLDAVSVRESYAVPLAQQFTEKKVEQICDPVTLLSVDDWSKICDKGVHKENPYIFAYSTSIRPAFTGVLKKLQEETGLRVIHVTWNVIDAIKEKAFAFPKPVEWLALLNNAEYVVTNSFHATVFSTILHKRFYTAVQDGRNVRSNIRLFEYLERMGLQDRLVTDPSKPIDLSIPDFSNADAELAKEREAGIAFLRQNLEAAYQRKLNTSE